MSTFKTVLPIPNNTEMSKVQELVKSWICNSPHSEIKMVGIEPEQIIKIDNESLEFIKLDRENEEHWGAQYIKREEFCEWKTEVVAFKDSDRFEISVISRRYDYKITNHERTPLRPYVIKMFMENINDIRDQGILIEMTPKLITKDNVNELISIINREIKTKMPIVYVSKPFYDNYNVVNVNKLAQWLSGFAHVYYEDSTDFTEEIRTKTNGNNPYNGAIAIYWPGASSDFSKYIPHYSSLSSSEHIDKLRHFIQMKLSNRKIDDFLQWDYLSKAKERDKIQKYVVQDKSLEELRELLEYVLIDNEEMRSENEELKLRNDIMENRVTELEYKVEAMDMSSEFISNSINIKLGNEEQLFTNEQYELILDAIRDKASNPSTPLRIKNILLALIEANNNENNRDKYFSEVRGILKHGRISNNDKKQLKKLRIEILEDGEHYKLRPLGDARYSMSIAKTPSDHCAGDNNVSTFKNTFLYR